METVVTSMRKLAAQAEDKEFQKALLDINKALNELPKKLPDLPAFAGALPKIAPDAHVPDSAQLSVRGN